MQEGKNDSAMVAVILLHRSLNYGSYYEEDPRISLWENTVVSIKLYDVFSSQNSRNFSLWNRSSVYLSSYSRTQRFGIKHVITVLKCFQQSSSLKLSLGIC